MVERLGLNRVRGHGGDSMDKPRKRARGFPQWFNIEGKGISCGEKGGRGAGWGTSMMITPQKGLISVPNFLCSCPLNDSLVSFVIIMLTNEFYPLMLSHPCFRWPRSLYFLPWSITSL